LKKFIFATNNPHKLEEIRQLVKNEFIILSLSDVGFNIDIPEDFDSLQENALQKARIVHQMTGLDCFADDTGLEIDALDKRPGVNSARYAGPECNSEKNIRKVLKELGDTPFRSARFKTIIALILNNKEFLFDGKVEGEIIYEKHGLFGFGYDPIFRPEHHLVTFAEMSAEDKNRISHRGKAVEKLIKFLRNSM